MLVIKSQPNVGLHGRRHRSGKPQCQLLWIVDGHIADQCQAVTFTDEDIAAFVARNQPPLSVALVPQQPQCRWSIRLVVWPFLCFVYRWRNV